MLSGMPYSDRFALSSTTATTPWESTLVELNAFWDAIQRQVCAQAGLSVMEGDKVAGVADRVGAYVEPAHPGRGCKLFFERRIAGEEFVALGPLIAAGNEVLI